MSWAEFIVGFIIMIAGFLMIYKTGFLYRYFGNLNDILSAYKWRWLNWKPVGLIFIILGFLYAFGLLKNAILSITGLITGQ